MFLDKFIDNPSISLMISYVLIWDKQDPIVKHLYLHYVDIDILFTPFLTYILAILMTGMKYYVI